MKRTHALLAACLLAATASLGIAPAALATENGDVANSFRYENGQQLEQDSPTATMGGSLKALSSNGSSYSLLANKDVWKPSYGTSYFYYSNSKVKTSGVKAACIDVSVWNGSIDWAKVKAAGVKYAIIRCGYGQDEEDQDDKQWARNVKQAQKNGIKLGVYLYSYAYNEDMAAGEANHVLRCLEDAGLEPGDLDLPVYYDLEEGGGSPKVGTHSISNLTLARMAVTWCNTIAAKGYNVGIYANRNWWLNYLDNRVFYTSKWSKWIAEYNKSCLFCVTSAGVLDSMSNYGKYLDIWQFSSSGICNGNKAASGKIDVNWIFNKKFNSANTKVKIPGPNISYDLNGGKNNKSNPTTVTGKSITFKPKNPTKTGYKFMGWYTSASFESSSKVSKLTVEATDNVKLYAKWKKITYSISYSIDGVKMSEANVYTTSYNVKTATFSLPVPTREGSGFAGWYSKKKCTGTAISQVKKGSTGNLELYGTWIEGANNYKVTASSLSVRKKAKTSAKKLGTLSKNEVVCITKTKTAGKEVWGYAYQLGWVSIKYTKQL